MIRKMKIALELVAAWVAFSCIAGPFLTWAFFRAERFAREGVEMAAPDLSIV